MLKITVPPCEQYNEELNEFISTKEQTLQLEHSLVAVSKWESKWCKPFLSEAQKTYEEMIDYIRFMTITQNVDPNVYTVMPADIFNTITKYIESPMTATWFSEETKGTGKAAREVITSELIYYWMISMQIPFECQKWHLNRLLTLIRVCGEKNKPAKKMNQHDVMSRNRSLNAARRAKSGSRG